MIGAVRDSHAGRGEAGSAYVFVRAGNNWIQQAKLNPSDAAAGDHFGRSVAIFGDTVLVGAPDSHVEDVRTGSAYIFVRNEAGGWTQQGKLTGSDSAANHDFGQSVALAGDTAVVGASRAGGGRAYVFIKPEDGWTDMSETAKLNASDGGSTDQFGNSVALSGNTVVVGAWVATHAGGTRAGAAYIFTEPPVG